MEKFFLCRFLTDNKLDIIDEEDVVVSVFFTELRGGNIVFVPDRQAPLSAMNLSA